LLDEVAVSRQVICPHCQNPIAVEEITSVKEILCAGCGSSFQLDPASTAAWPPPKEGQRKLGKFDIIDTVGFGAFGTVFKAHDPELDRIVAIKVPRSGNLATGDDLNRFLREARSVARLRHPSIVPVYEVGQVESMPYLVSEFVQGMTLGDLMTARRLPADKAAVLMAEVADALQYAHDQGVVHRDVKPSNILLDNDNHPHLMDFGLAKREAGEVTMTLDGQVLGTPAYMSPEQAGGEGHKVDGRSDVYSLGVILYQLLTGELPFKGNTRALLHQVQHDEPPAPRQLAKGLSRDLETICLKAMAKDREQRYGGARALAEDLRRFLNGQPILARPPTALERSVRWLKRRRGAVAAVAGAVGLSLLVGLVVFLVRPERVASDAAVPAPPPSGAISTGSNDPKDAQQVNDANQAATIPLPADLALVAQDTDAFGTLRVAELVEQPAIKRFLEQLGKYEEVSSSIQSWESEFEKAVGVKPADVERLTVMGPAFGPGAPSNTVILINTRQPYEREGVLARLVPGASEKQHAGKSYHVAAGPGAKAVHFFSDRVVVTGASEEALQAFLNRLARADAPGQLRGTLALAEKKYQVAVGLDAQSLLVKIFVQAFTKGVNEAFTGRFAPVAEGLEVLKEVRTAVLLLNLRSAVFAGGDKLQLLLRLTFAQPDRARRAGEKMRAAVPTLTEGLRAFVDRMAKNPDILEQFTGGMLSARAGAWVSQFYDQLALALQAIDIRAEGNVLDIRLNDLTVDVGGLGTFMGDSMRMGQSAGPNLLEMGVALEDYIAEQRRLPPAAIRAQDGKPLLSWRVALLPYLGHKDLYNQFKLDESWDSPQNQRLLDKIPSVYQFAGPGASTSTSFRLITGPGTAFDDTRPLTEAEIKDGSANTIALIGTGRPVPWTKPEELTYAPDQSLPNLGVLAIFADGSVHQLKPGLDEKTRRQLVSRQGTEKVDVAQAPELPANLVGFRLNWASWQIVRQAHAAPDRYRWGLRLAERACKAQPNESFFLNTLGVAQYRVGQFREALATLTESDRLTSAKAGGSIVADLAFLAMSRHQLGEKDQARADLGRLREKMKEPLQANNEENQGFLGEAAALIEGK
jgi:serine/threonine protein kinase